MPYDQTMNRQNKGCILFLADQSYGMREKLAGTNTRKCDYVASAINGWIQNLGIMISGSEGIRDWMDIGVIGYRTDRKERPFIGSVLDASFGGRSLVPIDELHYKARIESRIQILPDDETGGMMEVPIEVPSWIDPVSQGGAPMCFALHETYQIVDQWIRQHPKSFPPMVIHFATGATSDGGDPIAYAAALKNLATEDGNVLFFNCCLSATVAASIEFPSRCEMLQDDPARLLFQMSSELPELFIYYSRTYSGLSLLPGARGMAHNADMVGLQKCLDVGSGRLPRGIR
jgi:hypothetical protein